jgi:hypothetical protein
VLYPGVSPQHVALKGESKQAEKLVSPHRTRYQMEREKRFYYKNQMEMESNSFMKSYTAPGIARHIRNTDIQTLMQKSLRPEALTPRPYTLNPKP